MIYSSLLSIYLLIALVQLLLITIYALQLYEGLLFMGLAVRDNNQ